MMNNKLKRSYSLIVLIIPMLYACGSGEDAFTSSGVSSTNLITHKNFSVGFSETNPAILDDNGFHGGVTVDITVRAGDRKNAAVTTGTVQIRTEYGILSASNCQLGSTGTCSVTWTSILNGIPADLLNDVVVYTTGEESFTDHDGSGTYNSAVDTLYADVGEPFLDLGPTRNGVYNPAEDILIDLDNDQTYDAPINAGFNGDNCIAGCGTTTRTTIFAYATMDLDARTAPTAPTALTAIIVSPASASTFTSGANITFSVNATDPEDGDIIGLNNPEVGNDIVWSSDLDGVFGTQSNSITVNTLSAGNHIITVTVVDSDGNTDQDAVAITITP